MFCLCLTVANGLNLKKERRTCQSFLCIEHYVLMVISCAESEQVVHYMTLFSSAVHHQEGELFSEFSWCEVRTPC